VAEKGDQERTEKPTGKKLSKAREEGQVAKSQEISTTFILFGAFRCISLCGAMDVLGAFRLYARRFSKSWDFASRGDFGQGVFVRGLATGRPHPNASTFGFVDFWDLPLTSFRWASCSL